MFKIVKFMLWNNVNCVFRSGKSQKRFREATKKIIDNLFASYDKRIRPNGANETDYKSR